MKIVHVCHLYHPSAGGVQYWFKNVSERLARDYGDDVTVVTTNSFYGPERNIFKQVNPAKETINGVHVIRFPYRRWHLKLVDLLLKVFIVTKLKIPEWLLMLKYGPHSRQMKRYLLSTEADVICASSSNYVYMQLPLWRRCRFLYFGSIHLPENEDAPVLMKTQLESIRSSYLYLANTNYEKQRLVKAGVEQDKIAVLGVGVDPAVFNIDMQQAEDFRTRLDVHKQDVLIAYVGRIEPTKSVAVLIKAFEKIAPNEPGIHLLIAGSGSQHAKELMAYCEKLNSNISSRIHWKLDFSSSEKAAIFHSLDILVLPSSNESFGIVFLEGWICKKPVVGVEIGAVSNVVENDRNGLLFKKNDVESLADKLMKLADNEQLREQFGRAGYEKAMANYTWDIITARLRGYYTQAVRDVAA